ncbi:transposable element Tcb2 transposase [Trichonephila clavipes]|nr:transposable element Tcb2 transposase [Trichonephila clavipes]
MNPIEHVWDALGRRVAGRQPPPQTLQELERALLEEWDRIPQLVIKSLIDSMPQRCMGCGDEIMAWDSFFQYTWSLEIRRHNSEYNGFFLSQMMPDEDIVTFRSTINLATMFERSHIDLRSINQSLTCFVGHFQSADLNHLNKGVDARGTA